MECWLRLWLALLLLGYPGWCQSMISTAGMLYPTDATGAAALSMAQLSQGLCPESGTGASVAELTIARARQELFSGHLTCHNLLETYLTRIEVYDKATGLNAIMSLAWQAARQKALSLDAELASARANGTHDALPELFCIPILVKDNMDVPGLATTAGAQALASNYPIRAAWPVAKLERAGAIVFGKTTMGEFALFPSFSVGSVAGFTRNPFHLSYSPGGSSGGSAAAVSANLAMAALGTDTGNSVRGPASHTGVVGLRPSIGLVGRSGVVPLRLDRDTVGPLARSVQDAATLLGVLAGVDPSDNATPHELGPGSNVTVPQNYSEYLDPDALGTARIGVSREILNLPGTDSTIASLFNDAIDAMRSAGAVIVDNFTITGNTMGLDWDADRNGQGPALGTWNVDGQWSDLWSCTSPLRCGECTRFLSHGVFCRWKGGESTGERLLSYRGRRELRAVDIWTPRITRRSGLDAYLSAANGTDVPTSLEELFAGGGYHPFSQASLQAAVEAQEPDPAAFPTAAQRRLGLLCGCDYWWDDPCRTEFREVRRRAMKHREEGKGTRQRALACVWMSRDAGCDMPAGAYVVVAPVARNPMCVMTHIPLPSRDQNLIQSMDRARVDVIIYPTWNSPPLKIGDNYNNYYDGNNSPMIAPQTGSPAITVPMGYVNGVLPAGLQFVARPFDEPRLLAIAYAYEQATHFRETPQLFPDCAAADGGPPPSFALQLAG